MRWLAFLAFLLASAATGSVVAPVFCNGSGWVYH